MGFDNQFNHDAFKSKKERKRYATIMVILVFSWVLLDEEPSPPPAPVKKIKRKTKYPKRHPRYTRVRTPKKDLNRKTPYNHRRPSSYRKLPRKVLMIRNTKPGYETYIKISKNIRRRTDFERGSPDPQFESCRKGEVDLCFKQAKDYLSLKQAEKAVPYLYFTCLNRRQEACTMLKQILDGPCATMQTCFNHAERLQVNNKDYEAQVNYIKACLMGHYTACTRVDPNQDIPLSPY